MIDLYKLKKEITEKIENTSDEELKKIIDDSRRTKQVIVIRKDLKMRRGKEISQACHASMKILLDYGAYDYKNFSIRDIPLPLLEWLDGLFTKIVVYVNSEQELLDIYNKAKEKNILCSLIQDSGLTEFNGIPTFTCCAIGPDFNKVIDEITGELPLL